MEAFAGTGAGSAIGGMRGHRARGEAALCSGLSSCSLRIRSVFPAYAPGWRLGALRFRTQVRRPAPGRSKGCDEALSSDRRGDQGDAAATTSATPHGGEGGIGRRTRKRMSEPARRPRTASSCCFSCCLDGCSPGCDDTFPRLLRWRGATQERGQVSQVGANRQAPP